MNRRISGVAALGAIAALTACAAPGADCTAPVRVADLPAQLEEASGIAAASIPDVLWAHNDSEGTPALHALDVNGTVLAEIAVPEAGAQFDWEDIAAGPCPQGRCLYIGDIGDNRHDRDDRAVLRIAEPSLDGNPAIAVDRFPYALPDGAEDAEALFVTADTSVYIITKGRRSAITLYRFPRPLQPGTRVTLERVQQLSDGIAQLPDLVTGADASDDGLVAVRTYSAVRIYRFDGDTLTAVTAPQSLVQLGEPQGEGVAWGRDGALYLVSEAGPQPATPFMSRMTCTIN